MTQRLLNKKQIATLISAILINPLATVLISSVPNVAFAQVTQETKEITYKFNVKSNLESPNVYNIIGSNKVIVDFFNYSEAEPAQDTKNNELIKSVFIKKVKNRLRYVFEMKNPVRYSITKDTKGFNLVISKNNIFDTKDIVMNEKNIVEKTTQPISSVSNTIPKAESTVNKPQADTTKPDVVATVKTEQPVSKITYLPKDSKIELLQVEKINIKKTPEKTAQITIQLNKAGYTPNFVKDGNNLIVDLKDVAISNDLQKNVNVRSLDTLVNTLDISTQKGSGKLILSQKDNWDYSFYQTDNKIVIEVKNKEMAVVAPKYTGKPLTLNFQNMEVRAILQVIADFTNLNILASDSVSGSMNVRLKDVPWDQALDLVLETKGLQRTQQGNVIWIATKEEISNKNKNQIELNSQQEELSPLIVEYISLNHYKAADMKAVLEGTAKDENSSSSSSARSSFDNKSVGFLSKRGSVGLDVRNNTIFIQDTAESIASLKKLIQRLDVPTKQVIIEAKLVVATDKFGKDLGAKFGIGGKKSIGENNSVSIGNSFSGSQVVTPGPNGSVGYDGSVTGGSIGFTILNSALGNYLSLELSALESKKLGQVISSPRLITSDNKKAVIQQGTQIPYTIPGSGNSAPTVNFKDAVLSLGVTPQVSPNGRVHMELDIKKDNVGQTILLPGGGSVPSIDTRSILTDVTVNNGQTVVLGGVYEVTSADDIAKVPFFGDLPFLGNLFKQSNKKNEKAELLIFITPTVVNDEDLDNLSSGTAQTEINIEKRIK